MLGGSRLSLCNPNKSNNYFRKVFSAFVRATAGRPTVSYHIELTLGGDSYINFTSVFFLDSRENFDLGGEDHVSTLEEKKRGDHYQ